MEKVNGMADFERLNMDQELLSELQDIMGDDFARLVQSWQSDTRQRVVAMEQAISQRDAVQLRQVAHSLKGSSGNLGARGVVDVCIEMEKLANLKDLDAANAAMPTLRAAIASAEQELFRLAC